ncbi:MAG TPA: methylmalonyl Co-A mutase-associated GTPase MeaB [Acidimicrobiales bacterium]|nr:methylmalonyl Co-A mutase-associated GTPase MeaB [Acidimicrobiales bacterium]
MPGRADAEQLVAAAIEGDRGSLARLISLVERGGPQARAVGRLTYPKGGRAYSVGITGAPGSGKSTLTDRLIAEARGQGGQVGVLAVDPSSPFSGGAILGDRVRMQDHAVDPGVFIRSMATRGHMGGLALAVPEAIRVLDAAGLPMVLVETVGVGQVELDVAGATDTTVVVVNPGWGDAVQANKAGLLEIADVLVINKADRPGARETHRDLALMLELSTLGDWRPPIVETAASTGKGISELWEELARHRAFQEERGALDRRRAQRLEDELRTIVTRRLEQRADSLSTSASFDTVRSAMIERRLDPYQAADEILDGLVG